MSVSTTMTIRLPSEVKEKLDRIASDTRRSRSFLAGEAVAAWVERELSIIAGLQEGLEDMAARRVTSHDDVTAEARRMVAEARQARASRK